MEGRGRSLTVLIPKLHDNVFVDGCSLSLTDKLIIFLLLSVISLRAGLYPSAYTRGTRVSKFPRGHMGTTV